jgi:oligoendopeptidase F
MKPIQPMALAVPILMLAARAGTAETRERAQIPEQYKWDLTEIYPSDEAWRTAKQDLVARIPSLESFKGKLGESAAGLLDALDTLHELEKELSRLYVYAGMSADQDTRVTSYQAMKQEIQQAASSFAAQSAFFEPEILRLDRSRIDGFLAELPKLKVYEHYLDDILRRKAHTGTDGEERIIAEASLMARGPQSVYGIFADADFPYPSLTLSDAQTVTLNQAAFARYRALPHREDRRNVFAAFFGALGKFERTFGTTLNANVQRDLFYMKARHYGSCLESALDANNVPVSVYHGLVEGVNQNLATFHRYLKLRQRILGLDQLHYYDLYAPLVEEVDLDYSPEEAQKLILTALAPLGEDYVKTVKRAFDSRWIDLFPSPGKRSGAYSNGGAYDVHPYMLINYNDKYTDVSTLAHELGHTMQSYYSNQTQPYATAGYPIFVAEVASTFNEALLIESMLKQIEDPKARLSLLGNYLEGIKGTVFRQTQFAEFELRMHERAERGEPLTGESLSELYQEITRRYYGHDAGVCLVDDEVRHEWSYIPHFYYNFYVFQYATSFTASAALSERVLAGDAAATKSYLSFLAAGGSKYPVELLKDAGVDMTTPEPLELTMRKMNRVIDEMEALLDQMGR